MSVETFNAFKRRFPRGVPARLFATRSNKEQSKVRFCVPEAPDAEDVNFLQRLAELGLNISWSEVELIVAQEDDLHSYASTIVFGKSECEVFRESPLILFVFPVATLRNDATKKREFWKILRTKSNTL
jgi:hypothetical protein